MKPHPQDVPPPHSHEPGTGADQLLAAVCRTTFDALLVVDDQRRYVDVNGPAVEMLGAPRKRVLRSRIEDFTPPEHHTLLLDLWRRLKQRGTLSGDYEVLRGDGGRTPIEFRASWDFARGAHLIAARHVRSPSPRDSDKPSPLTAREREVLQLASTGLTIREIGDELYISAATVKTHLENVYSKLRARDRSSAVAEGLRRGLIR
jgi:PAS domain S-box-containing protein